MLLRRCYIIGQPEASEIGFCAIATSGLANKVHFNVAWRRASVPSAPLVASALDQGALVSASAEFGTDCTAIRCADMGTQSYEDPAAHQR